MAGRRSLLTIKELNARRAPSLSCVPSWVVILARASAEAQHPLDSLTAAEIQATTKVLSAHPSFPQGAQFATIVLKEPPRAGSWRSRPARAFARQAFAVVLDRAANRTFEAVVDVGARRLVSWTESQGRAAGRPRSANTTSCPKIVKADPRWQAAMRKRGIDDFDKVQIDDWATGQVPAAVPGPPAAARALLLQGRAPPTSTAGRSRGSSRSST